MRLSRIEMTDPFLHFSDITHSIVSTGDDFIPASATDQDFQPIRLPLNRPLSFLTPDNQHDIRMQQQKFWDRISITPYFSQEFAGYNFSDNDITAPNGKEIEKAKEYFLGICWYVSEL